MKHISATAINTSLSSRMHYLQSFLQFDPATDGALIHACKPVLGPLVPTIVDAVYTHLLKYDITAAPFAPAQTAGQRDLHVNEVSHESDNIKFRKDFLKGYLIRLASNESWEPESAYWKYLDGVGKAHTGGVGDESGLKHRKGKPPLWVDYRDMGLLLGWVENALVDIVMAVEGMELETKIKVVRALNKLIWIQNDLFSRHYVEKSAEAHEAEQQAGEKVEEKANGVWSMPGLSK
jgi:hypothetical protein